MVRIGHGNCRPATWSDVDLWPCQNARACGTHRLTLFPSANVVASGCKPTRKTAVPVEHDSPPRTPFRSFYTSGSCVDGAPQTKLMACQVPIFGLLLLLLHQRTCRPGRSSGKELPRTAQSKCKKASAATTALIAYASGKAAKSDNRWSRPLMWCFELRIACRSKWHDHSIHRWRSRAKSEAHQERPESEGRFARTSGVGCVRTQTCCGAVE